jgi:hypothetical protein
LTWPEVAALAVFVAGTVAMFWLVLRYGGSHAAPLPPEPDVMRWTYTGPVDDGPRVMECSGCRAGDCAVHGSALHKEADDDEQA